MIHVKRTQYVFLAACLLAACTAACSDGERGEPGYRLADGQWITCSEARENAAYWNSVDALTNRAPEFHDDVLASKILERLACDSVTGEAIKISTTTKAGD